MIFMIAYLHLFTSSVQVALRCSSRTGMCPRQAPAELSGAQLETPNQLIQTLEMSSGT